MRKKKRQALPKCWQFFVTLAVAFAIVADASALSYSANPISAQVIDAETKEPLADVIVLVVWTLEDARGGSGPFLEFAETVSDARGGFHLSGWGPLEVPRGPDGRLWRLDTEQPVIFLFKSGFRLESVANEWESWMLGDLNWTGDRVRSSIWNNKQISLQRFHGSEQRYINMLSFIAGTLPLQGCRWAKIPRFTAALVNEEQKRSNRSQYTGLPTIQSLSEKSAREPKCPSPYTLLGPFLK